MSMRPCNDGRMKKTENFLKAVQILAPDDQFIDQAALCVSEESLPVAPGGAALEFVVAVQRLTRSAWQCKTLFKLSHRRSVTRAYCPVAQKPLALKHALKVKS